MDDLPTARVVSMPAHATRCPTCDREGCPRFTGVHEHVEASRAECPGCIAATDCAAHRADWRARALAAEANAARWRKVAPLIEAIADEMACDRRSIQRNPDDLIDAVTDLLAAAQEPTP